MRRRRDRPPLPRAPREGRKARGVGQRRSPAAALGVRKSQANELVRTFAEIDVRRVISSPYDRCVQTVQPLALSRGLLVETTEVLAETVDPALSRAFVRSMAPNSVLCIHGDVIPRLLRGIGAPSVEIAREPECAKGSIWAVQLAVGRSSMRTTSHRPAERPSVAGETTCVRAPLPYAGGI
ncbi:MAG: phosphoglycerate mutase family protein [Actinomycetota bacterium]